MVIAPQRSGLHVNTMKTSQPELQNEVLEFRECVYFLNCILS